MLDSIHNVDHANRAIANIGTDTAREPRGDSIVHFSRA